MFRLELYDFGDPLEALSLGPCDPVEILLLHLEWGHLAVRTGYFVTGNKIKVLFYGFLNPWSRGDLLLPVLKHSDVFEQRFPQVFDHLNHGLARER